LRAVGIDKESLMFTVAKPPQNRIELDAEWGRHKINLLTYAITLPGIVALERAIFGPERGPLKLGTVVTCHATPGACRYLKTRGVKMLHCPSLHAKAILVPGLRAGAVGSFNITRKAFNENFETCVVVSNAEYRSLEAAFNEVLKYSKPFSAGDLAPVPAEFFEDDSSVILEPAHTPHPFQQKLIQQLKKRLSSKPHKLGVCLKLPTGAGKTLVASEVVKDFMERFPDRRVLWLCHRLEVLHQAKARVAAQLDDLRGNVDFYTPGTAKYYDFRDAKPCLIVVDEAHRYHRNSKGYSAVEKSRGGRIPLLGMTATPPEAEKNQWGKVWNRENLVGRDINPQWLQEQGYLAELDPAEEWGTGYTFVFNHADKEQPERVLFARVGDFNNDQVNRAARKAWAEYKGRGYRRCLMFAVTKEHCDTLTDKFFKGDQGVRKVHSGMPVSDIRANLDWFKEDTKESRLLISIIMLTEGVDIPKVDSLFLVRPTFSRTLHDQMLGRGLRGPKAGGTDKCAVVDFTYSFEVKGGRAKLSEKQVVTAETPSTTPPDTLDDADDEGDSNETGWLPIPRTLGEAREQRESQRLVLWEYSNHVMVMLHDERQIDVDTQQITAALKSGWPDDVEFELALRLLTKGGKPRLPDVRTLPGTGRALKRWLDKADERGVALETIARVLGVAPGTLKQYQSKGGLPDRFKTRMRQILRSR